MTGLKLLTILVVLTFLFPWVRRRLVRWIGVFGLVLLCGLLAFLFLLGLHH